MLNTFENAERFHQRRLERERHISNMEVFSRVIESEEGRLTMAEALSGFSLVKNVDSPVTSSWRARRTRVPLYVGIALCSIGIVFVSILSAWGGLKYEDSLPNPNDLDPAPEIYNHRRAKIFSLVLDWGITPRYRLEDPLSAANMALKWLLEEDISTENPEDIRTRYSLATLFYGTQNASTGHHWSRSSYWLSSYRKLL
jgi:hypothetical protein